MLSLEENPSKLRSIFSTVIPGRILLQNTLTMRAASTHSNFLLFNCSFGLSFLLRCGLSTWRIFEVTGRLRNRNSSLNSVAFSISTERYSCVSSLTLMYLHACLLPSFHASGFIVFQLLFCGLNFDIKQLHRSRLLNCFNFVSYNFDLVLHFPFLLHQTHNLTTNFF